MTDDERDQYCKENDSRLCAAVPADDPAPATPGEPAVTLSDLATFRPDSPTLTGEPLGFGVAGLPTNIVAVASAQEIPGTLLGLPVRVRFDPAAYTFDYGDGTTATTDTGGTTWGSIAAAQFTPTATAHVYAERGTFTVSVTVSYAPWVDFGSGWRRVDGYVTATAGSYNLRVLEARTALVARDCYQDPSGIGC